MSLNKVSKSISTAWYQTLRNDMLCRPMTSKIDCKTVVFFANASDVPYSNERYGASVKTAKENGENGEKTTVGFPHNENLAGV